MFFQLISLFYKYERDYHRSICDDERSTKREATN